MTKELRGRLKDKLERATPGKWRVGEGDYVGFLGQTFFEVIASEDMVAPQRIALENAEYIAECCPDNIRSLLDKLDKQEKELIRAAEWLNASADLLSAYKDTTAASQMRYSADLALSAVG